MSVPALNQYVRLNQEDPEGHLHAGTIGVVHGFSFYNGAWGAEVDFYPPGSPQPLHRFEILSALDVVDGSLLPTEPDVNASPS